MAKINMNYYGKGAEIFEEIFEELHRYDGFETRWNAYDEEIADKADSAYYCDGLGCDTLEEAYFCIVEVIGTEEANEWLAERIDEEEMLGEVA